MKTNEVIGLTDSQFSELTQILAICPNIEEAIVYGSRAKGNYKPYSDVELTLKGEHLTWHDLCSIETMLDESSLPYQFDLSDYKTLSNPDLIDHINRRGIRIYSRLEEK